jgi:outer membrane protein assembly factor BamD (BamD/ComL family)
MNTPKAKFLFLPGFKSPERAVPLFEKILEHGPEWGKAPEVQYLVGWANELSQQYELAVAAYLTTQVRYPDTPFAEKAAYNRALCLERLAHSEPNNEAALDEAWSAMQQFAIRYSNSDKAPDVIQHRDDLLRRRAHIAYDRARYYDTIAHQPKAALLEYRDFVRLFPHSDWTPQAQKRIEALTQLVEPTYEKTQPGS